MNSEIVILNWNGQPLLERFLDSVVRTAPEGVGVVVADNGSTDSSVEWLKHNYSEQVEVLELGENYGFAEGYNRALKQLEADCFILLNSDVECPEGWCEPLLDYLEQNPQTAAVGPKILSVAERRRFEYAGASGGFIDRLGYPFCRGRILSTVEYDHGQYDDIRKVFWVSGACFAVRAEAFRRVGGFDGDFFAHMEEIDLCWRMQLCGFDIAVVPASRIYHLGGGTLPASSPAKTFYNFRNSLYMLHKNLPERRLKRTIRCRIMLDWLAQAAFFCTGRRQLSAAIRRAHREYRAEQNNLNIKREAIHRSTVTEPTTVYRGSILLRSIFCRRFGSMKI